MKPCNQDATARKKKSCKLTSVCRHQHGDCVSQPLPFAHALFSPFNFFSSPCLSSPQTNDFVRDKFTTQDGSIPLPAEILAGGCVSTM